jgi:hypothetical protein
VIVTRSRLFALAAAACATLVVAPAPSAQSPSAADALTQPLTATLHPPIPPDPLELWLAPQETANRAAPALARFSAGIRLHAEEKYREALPLISGLPRTSPLADYATYYTGLTQARLSRFADAEATFASLLQRPLTGYLA